MNCINLWSPLEIELLLKAHYSYVDGITNCEELINEGLLEKKSDFKNVFKLSPKGEAFVKMVLNTPMPVLKWTDPRTS